ncbi:MAG: BppU family phage baseplate upper protein [Clostridium sp.]|uniref:BppU family phage baseplate upper protein n=1 Tax=Clostridium sp. TaxID=1506 RepID=UPI003995B48B
MNTKIIKLDINNKMYETITAKQGDTESRFLLFHLFDASLPFDLTEKSVRVYGIKPDGTKIFNDLVINDVKKGYCTLKLTNQMLAIAGLVKLELVIYSGNKKLSSIPFMLNVISSLNSDDAVVSTNEFTSLMNGLAALSEYDIYKSNAKQVPGIKEEVSNLSSQLDTIAININSYPKIGAETELARIIRVISSVPEGSTILFPNNEYILNGDIVINRKVNLKGQDRPIYDIINDQMLNGVIFKDGKIRPNTDGITIENIGVFSLTYDNGFEGTQGACSNIIIKNCIARVRSHGFLFESYNGLNTDILIKDCITYKSTHGFISKAMNVTFDNCKAYNHEGGYGFGSISDNIPGATKRAIANNNNHINCYAENCERGFSFYCRDMYSTDNSNNMEMKNLKMLNCIAKSCTYPLMLGDIVPSTEHSRLTVSDAIIDNFTEYGTTQNYSIRLGHSINCKINNPILSKLIDYSQYASRISVNEFNSDRKNPKFYNIQLLEQNSNFPTVDCTDNRLTFKTNNTSTINIKGLLKGLKGIEVTIYINDNNTSILSGQGNIILSKSILKGKGSYVILKFDGTSWQELYLFDNNVDGGQVNLGNNSIDIDCNNGIIYDVIGTGTTSNTINVISTFKPQLTLAIRSVGGTFVYGGFGDKFLTNDIPTSLTFGKVIVANFIYIGAIKKYACVGWSENTL